MRCGRRITTRFFCVGLASVLSSCASLPYIVENSSKREVRLVIKAESPLFDELVQDGIFYESLDAHRAGTCANGRSIPAFQQSSEAGDRYLFIPPATRICFLTRINIESKAKRIVILDEFRIVELENRFDSYRTEWDVPGKVYTHEDD